MPIAPNTKMKQLQWDKLPQQQVSKTLWQEEEPSKEKEMIAILSSDGIWLEMEEDFKAKQLVINLLGAVLFLRLHQVILCVDHPIVVSPAETCRTKECS
jgi:cytokinesis protein